MALPDLEVTIRFATGPAFGNVLVLGSTLDGILGTNVLGTTANTPVDITTKVQSASIRRGRTRILETFDAGQATINIIDTDGTFDPDNGPYAGDLLPMRQVRLKATWQGTEYFLFSGFIDQLDYNYDQAADLAFVTLSCSDTFRLLNLVNITTVAGTSAGQPSGERVEDIFAQIGWPSLLIDADTGSSLLQDDPGTSRSALDAIKTIADSELGAFYMTGAGIARYRSRDGIIQAQDGTAYVFDDTGANIAYNDIQFAFDEQLLANIVTVQNDGGVAQTVSDSASITQYFERDLSRTGLLLQTDAEALDQARQLLRARKDPELRVESISLFLADGDVNQTTAALAADFFQPITVSRSQPGSGVITRTLTVQGISHDISPDRWVTRFSTAELDVEGFILNSSNYGVLGTNVLSY